LRPIYNPQKIVFTIEDAEEIPMAIRSVLICFILIFTKSLKAMRFWLIKEEG